MFTAALFTIAQKCKQPACLPTDEWISKMWYKHTMKYYSAVKRNEEAIPATTRMTFKNIMLSRRSQSLKTLYCMIPFS